MGKQVAQVVAARLGRTILELGGNNAVILTAHADLAQAIPAVVFGAVGTAGQRCTSVRRLIIHDSIYEKTKESLLSAYKTLRVGSPLDEKNHVGPLIDTDAVAQMQKALATAEKQGGHILFGGETLSFESKCYVTPALVEARVDLPIAQDETFAPILYLFKYPGTIENAIQIQNSVKQGLSSSVFTQDFRESETISFGRRFGLWNCQRQYRHFRCGNRWRFWWRKRDRRRPRIWIRRVESLHAATNQHVELRIERATRAGN